MRNIYNNAVKAGPVQSPILLVRRWVTLNKPAENIIIRNCETGAGAGITIGSETSGSVRNVEIYNIKAKGTATGFRLKSARTRGGLIENISMPEDGFCRSLGIIYFSCSVNR